MNSKLEFLRSQYGVVMTLEQLAKALSRKPGGLREALDKPCLLYTSPSPRD